MTDRVFVESTVVFSINRLGNSKLYGVYNGYWQYLDIDTL